MKLMAKGFIIGFISSLLLGCSPSETLEDTYEDTFENTWSYDDVYHFHKNTSSSEPYAVDYAEHTFGDWEIMDRNVINTHDFDDYKTIKVRRCTICNYSEVEGYELIKKFEPLNDFNMFEVLPKIQFATEKGTDFATKPTDKTDKPEVEGIYTVSNCPDEFKLDNAEGAMKVRGNQTARFSKKGFRIKFKSKHNLLGLNNNREYKKWVLLAEAKDSSLLRNSLALYLSKHIFGENVFVTDFVPVNLYINDEYWGVYILAEQKEVKEGRINLPEPEEGYEGTDIGYCFELDNYASREDANSDGDPTFTVQYKPKEITYQMEWGANQTIQHGYTMLSEITNEATQLPFIKSKVEQLYTILYNAAINNKSMCIEDGEIKDSINIDIRENLENYFDIDSFVDSYIFNEICCNPDVGYSSFFMSLDMSNTGDKKLRFDVPWDFDSSFGIRKNCMENAKGLYVNRSTNMWLNLFSKLDFFKEKVKTKWNELRENFVFENSLYMLEQYSKTYAEFYSENFTRWPTCIGKNSDAKNELTNGYLNVKNQTEALKLLFDWFEKRINNLEKEFGSNRPDISY